MKKRMICYLLAVITVFSLTACGGDLIHESNGNPMIGQCMHAYTEEIEAKQPTCTEDGHSAYTRCRMCGEALIEAEVLPATGHTWENDVCVVCGKEDSIIWDPEPPKIPDTPPTLQLFETEVILYISEDVWEFYSNAFVINFDTLTFASADESIATVDENGVVTPVSKGETVIACTAKNGDATTTSELAVTVKARFEPITEEDKAIFEIMRNANIPEFETYGTWSVNVTSVAAGKYNEDGLQKATAGPVEIWCDTLQLLFTLNRSEIDFSLGVGKEGYNYFLDMYYKPYDAATQKDGGYSRVTLQPWSAYTDFGDGTIMYRVGIGGTKLMDLSEGKYEVKFVVREGDIVRGWFTATDFTWTDSCVAFVNYAKNHSDVIK